jgi:hypothetical protein
VTCFCSHKDIHFFLGETRVWTLGFVLAKQVLYHLRHTSRLFCSGYFRDGVSLTICPSWPRTVILLISASPVARIIGARLWHLAGYAFKVQILLYYVVVVHSYITFHQMSMILFIHSSLDGNSGCFQLSAIMTSCQAEDFFFFVLWCICVGISL